MTDSDERLPPPPPEIADLAEACVRFVHDALALRLDYTPDTLPLLDHYVAQRVRGAKPEVVALIAPAAGAYFGEVVRRTLQGARWHAPAEADYRSYRLEFEPFFLCFNPLGVAVEALSQDDAADWGAHFHVLDEARAEIANALENADVSEEDYFTFSVRFEALEQVGDRLSALEARQTKRRHFGPEVYRAASGEGGGGLPS